MTRTVVPGIAGAGPLRKRAPTAVIRHPVFDSRVALVIVMRETAAIAYSAAPRKPNVVSLSRSSKAEI